MYGLIFVVFDIIWKNLFNGFFFMIVDIFGSYKVIKLCIVVCIMLVFMMLKLYEFCFLYLVIVVLKNKIIINMVRFWCLDIRYLMVVVRIV